jgi:hypothetical protein
MSRTTHLIASPWGDLTPTAEALAAPLEGCANRTPYARYFEALSACLAADAYAPALAAAAELCGAPAEPGDLDEVVIRAEKHGALYHPASAELHLSGGRRVRLGLLAATAEPGRAALAEEARLLAMLGRRRPGAHLPRVFGFYEDETAAIAVVEWFGDFHEFHAGADGGATLWDYARGNRELSAGQTADICRRAGRILGLLFDPASGARVSPWRHAAGDFIARVDASGVSVRLTTVRGYRPAFDSSAPPLAALVHFVLESALYLRLDRAEGTGQPVLLPEDCLAAGLEGIMEGLEEQGLTDPSAGELRALLATFEPEELAAASVGPAEELGELYAPLLARSLGLHALGLSGALAAKS